MVDLDEIERRLKSWHGDNYSVRPIKAFELADLLSQARAAEGLRAECDLVQAALNEVSDKLRDESAIVRRIWQILGSPTYEDLDGRSIYDLITDLKAERTTLTLANRTAESQLALCREALDKLAYREHVRMAEGGGFVSNGYSCRLCGSESSSKDRHELEHGPNCPMVSTLSSTAEGK